MANVTVSILDNGPLILKGEVEVLDGEGKQYPQQSPVALCRCGASQNRPFCDGAHSKAGFESAERVPEQSS